MLVQAGAFWMGSDSDDPNEAPVHRVYVRDFWIDRHKVTNAEFVRFLNARGAKSSEGEDYFDWDDADVRIHGPQRWPAGPYAVDPGFESHPAIEVTWFGARDYETLRVTLRRFYEHRGVSRGHHFIGFRCATSEDLGEVAK